MTSRVMGDEGAETRKWWSMEALEGWECVSGVAGLGDVGHSRSHTADEGPRRLWNDGTTSVRYLALRTMMRSAYMG
jgi:hypothetical protein